MVLAFDLANAVNMVFLLAVALCLAVGLLVAPQIHERDRHGDDEDIPPAFRHIADRGDEGGM